MSYSSMELGYPMPAHKSTARTRLVVIASVALATLGLHAMSAAGRSSARESSWTLSALLRSVQDGFRRTEGGPAASALLDVHAIAYGASLFPADAMFVDGDPAVSVRFGWLCYAVRYGREPWILVDAGFNDAPLARDFSLTEHVDPLKLLEEKLGLRAADVGTLIVTHHHFDHAGNVHRFPNAVVHMHAEVAETLRLPENAWDCPGALDSPQRRDCGPNHPKGTERLGSNGSSHWVPGRHASSLPERLAAAGLLRTFEGRWSDPILLGSDPNGHYLRIERVGGHAPGSCMVWLHAPFDGGVTPWRSGVTGIPPHGTGTGTGAGTDINMDMDINGAPPLGHVSYGAPPPLSYGAPPPLSYGVPPSALALLAGDEIYHPENLRQRRPTGVSVNASRSAAVLPYISAAQAAGTPVFTYHDPDVIVNSTTPGRRVGTRRVCCGA